MAVLTATPPASAGPSRDDAAVPRHPAELRQLIGEGRWRDRTIGVLPSYTQASLVIVPKSVAFEFLLFCQRNPKPCALLEVLAPGETEPRAVAPGADVRTDQATYRVWRHGRPADEVSDLRPLWRDDLVSFLFGCSATLDGAMLQAGIRSRFRGIYTTTIDCDPAGPFAAKLAVTGRTMSGADAIRAVEVTGRLPSAHGAPIHLGDPSAIGIADLLAPDVSRPPDQPPLATDEVPLFWACSVTAEQAAVAAELDFMVSFTPGHMFVTDIPVQDLATR
jgi:uncharacterized protein YcsI (UPF0317 family)